MEKTKEQIDAEVAALVAAKPRVRRTNYFGDNLHAAIDAQVRVLTGRMTEDDVRDEWEDPEDFDHNRYVIDSALDAIAWRDGEEREDAGHDSLAAGWVDIGMG